MTDTSGGPVVYSHEEALTASVAYFGGDEQAADVFVTKYALRDPTGALLEKTPDDMHRRLAREFARIESRYPEPLSEDTIFELLDSWRVVPQGSPMSAVGNLHRVQSLSNCFVVPAPHDSYGGILKTVIAYCENPADPNCPAAALELKLEYGNAAEFEKIELAE